MHYRTLHPRVIAAAASVVFTAFAGAASAQEKITYQDHALPIFRNSCMNCHNPDRKRAGLDLSNYAAAMAGGGTGKAVEPGDPDNSLLYKLITHAEEPVMPPRGGKLPDKDLDTIRKWIAGGALENSGSTAVAVKKNNDLAVVVSSVGKPDGPPPMPADILPLEPVVHPHRAGAIPALAASPWAPLVALGSQKQVLLYHTQSRDLLGVLPFPEGTPQVLKFSRSGKILLTGGGQGAKLGKVALYDVATGKRIAEVGDELDEVLAADVSPDQSTVALGGPSKAVNVYSTADGSLVTKLTKHTDWITAIAFSPDGVLLATGDRNGGLRVWEAHGGGEFYTLDAHKGAITDVAFRDDSNILASASEDGTIKLWHMVQDGKAIKSWPAHGGQGVLSIDFAHDGSLVSSGRDKAVKMWKADGSPLKDLTKLGDIALHAVISDDAKFAVAGDYAGEVRVISTADAKPAGTLALVPPTIAERLGTTQKKVAELTPVIATKVTALTAAQAEAAKAAAALAEAQKKAEEAAKLAAAAQAAHDAAAAQLVAAQQEEAKLKASQVLVALDAARAEHAKLVADHQQKAAEHQQAEAAAKQGREQVAALEKSIAEAPQRLTALEQQLAQATEAATAAAAASDAAKASVAERQALVHASTELQQKLADAAAKAPDNKAFADASAKSKESLEVLRADLTATESAIATTAGTVQKAQEAVAAAEAAVAKEKSESAAAPASLEKLKQTLAAAEADVPAKKTAVDAAATAIAPAKAKVDQLQAEFDALKTAAGVAPATQPAAATHPAQ